jgi:hypothetical protein
MPRFRIKTLLIFTAIIALGIFLWLRYITPNITGLSIQGSSLVIHQKPIITHEYVDFVISKFRPREKTFKVVRAVNQVIPFSFIAIGLAMLTGVIGGIYFTVRWFSLRRKRLKTTSPSA